jgi:transposase
MFALQELTASRQFSVFSVMVGGRFIIIFSRAGTLGGLRALILRLSERTMRTDTGIVLVMDQGNPHHAKVVHKYLDKVRDRIRVFWLPHYCP